MSARSVEGGDRELSVAMREHRWREVESLTPRGRALCEVAEIGLELDPQTAEAARTDAMLVPVQG